MPVPSTNTASGLCALTCSMTRLATCMRSGMRNFTAGSRRASRPRRKRMTLWSAPWRAMSTPMTSGAVGSGLERARRRLVDALAVDELQRAGAGEHAAHADADEVGILAVILHPAGDLRLVGHGHRARIDLLRGSSDGRSGRRRSTRGSGRSCAWGCRRLARSFRCRRRSARPRWFPTRCRRWRRPRRRGRRRVAPVVQAGEGLGVVLRPGDRIDPPGLVAAGLAPNGATSRCR